MREQNKQDWRKMGQERYLLGAKLKRSRYYPPSEAWSHDHCEFCLRKFTVGGDGLIEGYTTEESNRWICKECFNDFKSEFNWMVE